MARGKAVVRWGVLAGQLLRRGVVPSTRGTRTNVEVGAAEPSHAFEAQAQEASAQDEGMSFRIPRQSSIGFQETASPQENNPWRTWVDAARAVFDVLLFATCSVLWGAVVNPVCASLLAYLGVLQLYICAVVKSSYPPTDSPTGNTAPPTEARSRFSHVLVHLFI